MAAETIVPGQLWIWSEEEAYWSWWRIIAAKNGTADLDCIHHSDGIHGTIFNLRDYSVEHFHREKLWTYAGVNLMWTWQLVYM